MAWARATRFSAIPCWAKTSRNRNKILNIYIKAQVMNMATKRRHEVDHIIPLYSNNICGLHCAENLQILSKEVNQNKSNYFAPYRELNGRKYKIEPLFPVILPEIKKKVKKSAKIAGKPNPTKKNPRKLAKKRNSIPKPFIKVATFSKKTKKRY